MKKSLRWTAVSLTLMMIVSKCLGIVRDSFLAYKFGTSSVVDAYVISLSFANVALSVFTLGFSESYITVHSRTLEERRNRFFNNTLSVILVGSSILAVLGIFLGNQIAYIMAPGFDAETHRTATVFLKIIGFVIPFQSSFAILAANEMAHENFAFPRFCDFIVINALVIVAIGFANSERPYILPIGYVIANIIAVVALAVYSTVRNKHRFRFSFHIKDKDFRLLLSLAVPLGISFVINDLNSMTDGMFASTVGSGMTSALSYANKIQTLFLTVTINIISVVCFPRVAAHIAKGEKDNAQYYLRKSMMLAVYLAIPFMVFLLFYSRVVVQILFQRGSFSAEASAITSSCLAYYAFGVPFYAMSNVENQALAANAKQKLVMYITAASVVMNILLDYVLLRVIGYLGLPLATCCAGVLQFSLLMNALRKID